MFRNQTRDLLRRSIICVLMTPLMSCSTASKDVINKPVPTENLAAKGMNPNPNATSQIPARREFPVNDKINPCDNFYEYACSNVISGFKLRDDRSRHTFAFSDSDERILEAKKKFLKDLMATKNTKSKRQADLKNVFSACMNEEASKKEELTLVKNLSNEIEAVKSYEEFQNFVSHKILSKDATFLEFDTIPNLTNSDLNDVILAFDIMHLPERSFYDRPEITNEYKSLLADFFKTIGLENAEKRAQSVFDFEKTFAQTYPLPAEFRELQSKPTQISKQDLVTRYPRFKLDNFLKNIPNKTLIRDMTPENYAFMNKALAEVPLEVLKDAYRYQAIRGYMDDAYPEFFKHRFEFQKRLGGPQVRPVREERCTTMIMGNFTKEIDAEVLPLMFPKFPTEKFIHFAENVRKSIIEGLKDNTWLSAEGRAAAIKKITVAKLQLVKPMTNAEWDFNPPARYSASEQYENGRVLRLNLIKKELAELKKPRDKSRWHMGPLTVNAYYSPSDNKFVLPIGILQYPFYDPSLPDEVNLGAVGAVIGHELGHGIDDQGSRYDETGKLHQWLSEKDLAEFKMRGSRLVSQFNAIGHNGQLTLGENIGDLVGVTFAYQTAFKNRQASIPEKRAFFTQYARVWCTVMRPELETVMLKTNPHSMGYARVNEQIKHQVGFAEAFGCTAPKDPVRIW